MMRQNGHVGKPGRGFTMIELMMVVGIIVLIAGVTLPSFNRMVQGNAQKQAVNMISAYAAQARAMALRYKRPVALVFYEDGSGTAGASRSQTRVALAIQTRLNADGTMELDLATDRAPEYLPTGVKVASLNDMATQWQVETTGAANTAQSRAILFDQNGQLVLRRGLLASVGNGLTAPITAWWGMTTANPGVSSPAVLVYDGRQLDSAIKDQGMTATAWLNKNADIVVINTTTGNVIR